MRAFVSAMLLILIVLVDAGTASSRGWDEIMDRKRWQDLKSDLAKTKKEMLKQDRQIQQNFSTALTKVEEKIDQMKEGFLSFGLLFSNLLTNIQHEDINGNLNIDALTQSEDTLDLSEEDLGDKDFL